MKNKNDSAAETSEEIEGTGVISLFRAKEIVSEEGIDYSDDELKEVLHFISKVVSITISHCERTKQKEANVININTNTTHETKSVSLHQSKYRRAS